MSKFSFLSSGELPDPGPRQILGEELFGNLASMTASGVSNEAVVEYLAELRRLGHLREFDMEREPEPRCSPGRFVRARRHAVLGIDYDPGSFRDSEVRAGRPYTCHHILDTQTNRYALGTDDDVSRRMVERLEANPETEPLKYRWHRVELPYTWREDMSE